MSASDSNEDEGERGRRIVPLRNKCKLYRPNLTVPYQEAGMGKINFKSIQDKIVSAML